MPVLISKRFTLTKGIEYILEGSIYTLNGWKGMTDKQVQLG